MQQEEVKQIVAALQNANNVLVTVKNSPTVDELSAAIGLTLALNKMDKHAITVFSGSIPSTIDFLKPEQSISTNTDSLRDFIIALDKSKADKLRYKVEDSVVRIFITPYKTAISEKDLDFSQGDFNVDVVVALGVVSKEDFDSAVIAHGRILHDAAVISVTNQGPTSDVGSMNWQNLDASSISEMIVGIVEQLGSNVLDGQMSTAFLTGIVAETDRFKNAKTTPAVLAVGSRLMSAGANQQLIAEKLEQPVSLKPVALKDDTNEDGSLEIQHDDGEIASIEIDEHGNLNMPVSSEDIPQSEVIDSAPEPVEIPKASEEISREYVESPISVPSEEDSVVMPDTVVPPEQPNEVLSSPTETATELDAIPSVTDSQIPVLEHGRKTIQPLSSADPGLIPEPQQQTEMQQPAQSVDDYLGSIRETVAQAAVSQPPAIPPRNESIGAIHMDLTTSVEPQNGDVVSSIPPVDPPVVNSQQQQPEQVSPSIPAMPAPTPTVVDTTVAPAVPPPIIPPVAGAQPQFFDAEGNNANPFLNPTSQG